MRGTEGDKRGARAGRGHRGVDLSPFFWENVRRVDLFYGSSFFS